MMEEDKSKSQKKKEAEHLQKMGVKFVALNEAKLKRLPLTEELKQAIAAAKKIKSHGAMRRQAQLIGKLMRAADHESILSAYESIVAEENATSVQFHQLEHWRERLIHEGNEALTEFVATYQPSDIQKLRQLIKKAQEDIQKERNTGAHKALFQFIRSIIL